jgi:hypothetical protein
MKTTIIYIILFFTLMFMSISLYAQVVINEFSAKNTGAIYDFEDDSSDWIEIYNENSTSYDLTDHFLSDNFDTPQKWQFPSISIPANDRIIIFASGKDVIGNYPHTNFKLSADGEEIMLSRPDGTEIDAKKYDALSDNFSLGRVLDGSDEWACFSTPTPNTNNNLSNGLVGCYINNPAASLSGGFYDNPISLEMSTDGNTIYYSTDGSIPTEQSLSYNGTIDIDTTTVIRAVSYSPEGYYSLPETNTYIINEGINDIPVISIATDPYNLWSEETGIYIPGPNAETIFPFWGANFWEDWTIPISMEFFEEDQALAFKGRYDTKIHGGRGTRSQPMKALRILAKDKYENPYIEHQIFPKKTANQFKRIVLRNSGSDFCKSHFRDGIAHDLVLKEGLDIDVNGYRPCIVFLNGVFWGIHNIREKLDEYYLQSNYGVDIENVDILEEQDLVVLGNFDIFDEHEAFVLDHNLSNKTHFQTAASYFDLESMTDYFITQTYHNNFDWPNNNIKYWRERKEGAKWRYLMFDLDAGLDFNGLGAYSTELFFFTLDFYQDINRQVKILLEFLENEEFKRYFINRYADLINTSFKTENYKEHLANTKNKIAPYINRHFEKWDFPISEWDRHIDELITPFIELRPDFMREDIRNYFQLENTIDLNFNVFPENAGTIKINTLLPERITFPWNGIYYKNLAIDLTAIAQNNYAFQYWTDNNGDIIGNTPALQKAFENDESITAHFRDISNITSLEITPNPTDNYLLANINLPNEDNVVISIYDAAGKLIISENKGMYPSGIVSFPLGFFDWSAGVYFLKVQQGDFRKVGRFLVR